jgi:hypothetical protein
MKINYFARNRNTKNSFKNSSQSQRWGIRKIACPNGNLKAQSLKKWVSLHISEYKSRGSG